MDAVQKEAFKRLLMDQLHALQGNVGLAVRDFLTIENTTADPLDLASFDTDYSTRMRIRDRESHLINKIMLALRRLEDGSFGICSECGCDISIARLKARPVANLCIKCKTRQEARERIYG